MNILNHDLVVLVFCVLIIQIRMCIAIERISSQMPYLRVCIHGIQLNIKSIAEACLSFQYIHEIREIRCSRDKRDKIR